MSYSVTIWTHLVVKSSLLVFCLFIDLNIRSFSRRIDRSSVSRLVIKKPKQSWVKNLTVILSEFFRSQSIVEGFHKNSCVSKTLKPSVHIFYFPKTTDHCKSCIACKVLMIFFSKNCKSDIFITLLSIQLVKLI